MIEEVEKGAEKAKKETEAGVKSVEDYKKANPLEQMIKKEKQADEKTQALCGEIKKKFAAYIKKGDLEGAKRYLNHVRSTL